jgi:hypothetical protein
MRTRSGSPLGRAALHEDFDALSHIASLSDAIWITSPQAVGRALTDGDLVAIPITWLPERHTSR